MNERWIAPLHELSLADVAEFGGKNASLGEMLRELSARGIRVPGGFALSAAAYRLHLVRAGLFEPIHRELEALDLGDREALESTSRRIRDAIRFAPLPEELAIAIRTAYRELAAQDGAASLDVAVRSSATAEDLPEASFAGQQESYLNVRGEAALEVAVRACMASLFSERAISYRRANGFRDRDVGLSVGVQKMVRSDLACAGVIFTLDTESGSPDVVLVSGVWGVGEALVKGQVDPDEFWVHKASRRAGHRALFRRELGSKASKLVYGGAGGLEQRRVADADRLRPVLTDDEVLQLSDWALRIEEHYSAHHGRATPMDIEWAKDGRTGELFVVQARPETVHSRRPGGLFRVYRLRGSGELLARGKNVGTQIACGPLRVLRSPAEIASFRPGEVLVAGMTDPDWEPVLRRAAAVVTDHGGRTCHAAIVAREIGIPCVVGAGDATQRLRSGAEVTVSCAEGEEGRVYAGRIPFEAMEIDPGRLPAPRVPLLLNLANPDSAFQHARLPAAGVGLLRLEFLINRWIGVHPMALLHPEQVDDADVRARIAQRIRGFDSGADYFVERMAAGVATIAAAFHPRPVTVRFSDFKTNEYANLLGGSGFEPHESNPMLGFRGAARYVDPRYRPGFELECRAIRRVREEIGLANVRVMIPFCRSLGEARAVQEVMRGQGLERGREGLEIWMMCEIPSNVILADDFAQLFDGFSIGSNDLTQLTLGVDRDSELLAERFDERDPAIERLLVQVIAALHARGLPVGLCGQAPSDHPEFAERLADLGIDSISLTPDAFLGVAQQLAKR